MGANWFWTSSYGHTAQEAFDTAVEDAKYEFGHGGYTGSIAEKGHFTVLSLPDDVDFSEENVEDLVEHDSTFREVEDKWGSAGCLKHPRKKNTWVFFGYASS